MRVIIAGSRSVKSMEAVEKAIKASGFRVSLVLSGMAAGVDLIGWVWAINNGVNIEQYPVSDGEWRADPAAGLKRNQKMADNAEALIAVWDGSSPGTKDMIERAQKNSPKVHVEVV